MSDTFATAPPFPAESATAQPGGTPDPLAGDWSEGLPGPVRALGIPEPKLLSLDAAPAAQVAEPPEIAEPQFAEPQFAEPQFAEPQFAEPQFAEPQFAEPQFAEPQFAEPQFAEPQFAEPQFAEPQQIAESRIAAELEPPPAISSEVAPAEVSGEWKAEEPILAQPPAAEPGMAPPEPLPSVIVDMTPPEASPAFHFERAKTIAEEPAPENPPAGNEEPAAEPTARHDEEGPAAELFAPQEPAAIVVAPTLSDVVAPLPSVAPASEPGASEPAVESLSPLPPLADLPDLPPAPSQDLATTIVDTHFPALADLASAPQSEPAPDPGPPDAGAPAAPMVTDWSAPPAPAPTPWSEPVAAAPEDAQEHAWSPAPAAAAQAASWDQPAAEIPLAQAPMPGWDMAAPAANEIVVAEDLVWSSPPPAAEPAQEWEAPAEKPDWQEAEKPEAVAAPIAGGAAAWGTMGDNPDWSAASAAPAQEEAWAAAPPPAAETDWDVSPEAPALEEWSAPPAPPLAPVQEAEACTPTPSAPPEPGKAAAPAWNAPAVGASALEQLDSETMEAEPGAAQHLFGSVSGSLSGDNDDLGPPEELSSPEQFLRPVELASPEEVLKPLDADDDDPDLPVALEPPAPPRMALAQMRPASFGALEVAGEHRVAVHMRRGGTRRGTLRDVDLSKSSFSLLPQGGGEAEPVYHAEVRAIFFMLAPGEKPRPPDGKKVVVTFADGRTIEGLRDGADAKHGFFLVPSDAARTNTRRIYIAREATSDVKDG